MVPAKPQVRISPVFEVARGDPANPHCLPSGEVAVTTVTWSPARATSRTRTKPAESEW